ncbi:MAG: glycoside hydrolase family 13 protein [Actinomycetota bacterium]
MSTLDWWRTGAIYQVYIRSFADADGDGTGDVEGLRSKLPYLADLGVDAIWINPWYPSPLLDGGYDVADYRDINPAYGTLEQAEAMIADAHELGIKIIVDLVPNHCSWDHVWFKAAIDAEPGSPERARFHFKDSAVADDGTHGPPNNWQSVFGGSAWTQVADGQWYLHLFDPSQPDLDWTNQEVRDEFVSILRFWLDRGADGFRVDVAHGLAKDMSFPDLDDHVQILSSAKQPNHAHWDRDEVHEIIREWRAVLNEYDDRMMVAEAWVAESSLPKYLRPDEYHQSFSFDLLMAAWDAHEYRSTITGVYEPAAALGAASTWVLSNHDVMRHTTRFGLPDDASWRTWPVTGPADALDTELGEQRARTAAMITLGLPGSSYIYQGEELGLPEVWELPWDVLDDPVARRSNGTQKGRDGCRVPIPWTAEGSSYGFGDGGAWMPQPDRFAQYAADQQVDVDGSFHSLYRNALRIRREHFIADADMTWVDTDPGVLAYERGSGVRCVANMGTEPIAMPDGELLLSSQPGLTDTLPANSAVWLKPA